MGRSRRPSSRRRNRRSSEYNFVQEEEHLACECQCRIQETDCIETQRYDPQNCMCMCTNVSRDEKMKCDASGTHYWDHSSCACKCIIQTPCSYSQYFNDATCQCVTDLYRTRFSGREPGP